VVRWSVAGKTPEQVEEARVEAMGLADARAVQRAIDSAAPAPTEPRRQSTVTQGLAAQTLTMGAFHSAPIGRGPGTAAAAANPTARDRVAGALGLRDGAGLKQTPRVYAFAAVSGRGMGLNVTHEDDGWKNAGLTTDRGGFSGQRQAGLAWRTGPAQTSLSYVADKDRTQILGMQSLKDHRLMLTMAVTPQAIAGLFAR